MNLSVRLNLIFEGYTDDSVGLITYVLNHKFKISESTVRKLLETDEQDKQDKITLRGLEMDIINAVVKRLLETPLPKPLAGEPLRTKPNINEVSRSLILMMDELGLETLADSQRLLRLSNFIHGSWDELIMLVEPPKGKPDTGDIEAELARVPEISLKPTETVLRGRHSRQGMGKLHMR
jgi:hypothetical protein